MKAVITRDSLLSALDTAIPLCSKKHTNPVLSRVRLKIGGELWFMATDTVVSVTGARDVVECEGNGDFCAAADPLADAVRRMPEGPVKLKLDPDGKLEVTAGKRSFRAVTLPAEDFPPPPERPKAPFVAIPANTIGTTVRRVRFAMSTEDRPHDGIRVILGAGLFEAQAFDMRKVALARAKTDATGTIDMVLPPRIVEALLGVTERYAGDVGIVSEGGALFVETPAGLFRYSSSAVATFPPEARKYVENESGGALSSPTKPLIETIKYTELASGREAPAVYVTSGEGKFRVHAIDGQREASDEIDVDGAEAFRVKINPQYLLQALAGAGESCRLILGDNLLRVSAPDFEAGIARLIE